MIFDRRARLRSACLRRRHATRSARYVPVGVQDPVLRHGAGDGGHQEGRERQVMTGGLGLPKAPPSLRHIDLDQAVDDVLAPAGLEDVDIALRTRRNGRVPNASARASITHLPAITCPLTQAASAATPRTGEDEPWPVPDVLTNRILIDRDHQSSSLTHNPRQHDQLRAGALVPGFPSWQRRPCSVTLCVGGSADGAVLMPWAGRNHHGARRCQVERCNHGFEGIERHCARHSRR